MRTIAVILSLAVLAAPLLTDDVKTGTISGKVTFNGKPLQGGTISFHIEKAKITGPIAEDGSFKALKVPVGEAKVTVETESIKPKDVKPSKAPSDPDRPADKEAGRYVPIPLKFAKPETSGLRVEVKEGEQTLDVTLNGN